MRKIILSYHYLIVLFAFIFTSCNEIEESTKFERVDVEEYSSYTLPDEVDVSGLTPDKLYVIRNTEQFKSQFGEDIRPGIDFAANTLLLVKGQSYNGMPTFEITYYKDEKENGQLQLDVITPGTSQIVYWVVGVLVPALPTDKTVGLWLNR